MPNEATIGIVIQDKGGGTSASPKPTAFGPPGSSASSVGSAGLPPLNPVPIKPQPAGVPPPGPVGLPPLNPVPIQPKAGNGFDPVAEAQKLLDLEDRRRQIQEELQKLKGPPPGFDPVAEAQKLLDREQQRLAVQQALAELKAVPYAPGMTPPVQKQPPKPPAPTPPSPGAGAEAVEKLIAGLSNAVNLTLGPTLAKTVQEHLSKAMLTQNAAGEVTGLTGLGKAAGGAGIALGVATFALKEFQRVTAVATEITRQDSAIRIARMQGDTDAAAIGGLKRRWDAEAVPIFGRLATLIREQLIQPLRDWQAAQIEAKKAEKDEAMKSAQRIAPYSAPLSAANARAEIARIQGDMKLAQQTGAERAPLIEWEARRSAAAQQADARLSKGRVERRAQEDRMETFLQEMVATMKSGAEAQKLRDDIESAKKRTDALLELKVLAGRFKDDFNRWTREQKQQPQLFDYFDLLFKKQLDHLPHQMPHDPINDPMPPIEPML